MLKVILILTFVFATFTQYAKESKTPNSSPVVENQSCALHFSFIFQQFFYDLQKKATKKLVIFNKADDKSIIENYSKYYNTFKTKQTDALTQRKELLSINQAIFEKFANAELKQCQTRTKSLQETINNTCPKLTSTNPEEKKNLDKCTKEIMAKKEVINQGNASSKAFYDLMIKLKKFE